MFATKNLQEETEKSIPPEDAITAWNQEEPKKPVVQLMTPRPN